MGRPPLFQIEPLTRAVAVGMTGSLDVRVWVRSPQPGTHRLELFPLSGAHEPFVAPFQVPDAPARDRTAAVTYPAGPEQVPLVPASDYRFRVVGPDGGLVGEGRFRTAPDDQRWPDRIALAVLSCHMPFGPSGATDRRAMRLLDTLEGALEAEGVERVLLVGDQMYSDEPEGLSLFDREHLRAVSPPGREHILRCSRAEVRSLYQDRYRLFWSVASWKDLLAGRPTYPILDDHEVIDNFGSDPVHSRIDWDNLREGALDAYYDYQGLRVLPWQSPRPRSFDYGFVLGPVAGYVLDLRSRRRAEERDLSMFSGTQLENLERFLRAHRHRPVFVLVLSVPLLHVPDWMVRAGALLGGDDSDAADRWSYEKAHRSRSALLHALHAHQCEAPEQQLVVAGGDIHIGLVSRLRWPDRIRPIMQVVSSAVSNLQSPLLEHVRHLSSVPSSSLDAGDGLTLEGDLVGGTPGHEENPVGDLNAGILEVTRGSRGWQTRVKLLAPGSGPAGYRIAFDTGRPDDE